MTGVDSKYMAALMKGRKGYVLLLISISLGLQSRENILTNKAVIPPPKTLASINQEHEGSEIDEQIENYFKNIVGVGKEDIDQKKLSNLFGDDSEIIENDSNDIISLANRGSLDYMSSYRVQAGDTIYKISQKSGLEPDTIIRHNPELKKRPLYIGEEIIIVKSESGKKIVKTTKRRVLVHKIKKGEFLSHVAKKHNVSLAQLYKWNRLDAKSIIQVGQSIKIIKKSRSVPKGFEYVPSFIWPVQGVITSSYGRRSNPFTKSRQYHKGIDIGVPIGTPFKASRDGVVILSARMGGYGNCIFIRHINGYVSVYGHNKINLVKVGDVVKKDQIIGEVGRTGTATGPHLHFEVRKWKKPLNPFVALSYKELAPRKVVNR